MTKNLEIIATYLGDRMHFDNSSGTVVIGTAQLLPVSKESASNSGVSDPDEPLTVKGDAEPDELEYRKCYRFLGHFVDYYNKRISKKEKQFHFRSFVPHVPHDIDGLSNYLTLAGKGNGIGPAKARKLVETIGCDNVLTVCREQPMEVESICSITYEQAVAFSEVLQKQQATENASLEVNQLLTNRGFPKSLTRKVIREWGNRAAEVIKDNPYLLMKFSGVGFRLADKLYIELGLDPVSIDRQALCLWYGMASDMSGDVWFPAREAVKRLQQAIGAGEVDCKAAIIHGRELGQTNPDTFGAIASIRTEGEDGPLDEQGSSLWLAEGKYASHELSLAEMVASAIKETEFQTITLYDQQLCSQEIALEHARCHRCHRALTADTVHILAGQPYGPTCIDYVDPLGTSQKVALVDWLGENTIIKTWIEESVRGWDEIPAYSIWPEVDSIDLIDEHQQSELGKALRSRVAILAGSPGTGKTFTVSQMVKAMLASGRIGLHEIGIGAPTGKACVRLTELLQAAGIETKARTWHSLLGIGEQTEGGWTFKHNQANPLPYRVLIGDEMSMADLAMMRAIFAARQPGCHVLLVGDTNQLPPVGCGAPLRDLIQSEAVGYGQLTEIKRNSGGIVEACAAMRDRKPWRQFVQQPGTNLENVRCTKATTLDAIEQTIQLLPAQNLNSIWDCQVLVAVNDRSELSRKKLNTFLQEALNSSPKIEGCRFRERDKIVCLKNGYFEAALVDDTDVDVQLNESGEVYVANGELGSVDKIVGKRMVVSLDNPRRVIYMPLGKSKANDESDDDEASPASRWDLGYALSVHKSQGSEWPVVMIVLDDYPGARMICDMSWLYTAISRAKQKCYLFGDLALAERFCRVQKINSRKTFLNERIRSIVCQEEMAGL